MASYYSKAYLSTQVATDDRLEAVISLYEGVIGYVTQAMAAVEAGDAERRGEMIHRAARIISALSESLDYTLGEGVAGNLMSVYNFSLQQLLKANRANDIEPLQIVTFGL